MNPEPRDFSNQPKVRRLMREKVRQLARTALGEEIGRLFYTFKASVGWNGPNARGRRIGLPWSPHQSMHGLAVAFIRFGLRETARIAREAGYSASEVAKWAIAARHALMIDSRDSTIMVRP